MQNHYEIIIVGAGPIGMACGIEAQKRGLNYLIVEKGSLVNSLYKYPLYMTFFSTSERLEIGDVPFTNITPKPGRQEALEYYRRVYQKFNLNIHLFEEVNSIELKNELKLIKTTKSSYLAKYIIIATGFFDSPNYLNIPGENLSKVSHYYKEAHPYSGQKVVVVGANNSAVDAALECWRKGADLTMVIREGEIHQRVKYWVRPDIENRIEEGSIKAYFNSNLTSIQENAVIIDTPNGEVQIENDFVLAMTGYRPNFAFLEMCGIKLSDDELRIPTYSPDTMESNVKGIYLAGVVCGGMETHKWFIENSRVHAEIILQDIDKK